MFSLQIFRSPKVRVAYFTQHHVDQLDMSRTCIEQFQAKFPEAQEQPVWFITIINTGISISISIPISITISITISPSPSSPSASLSHIPSHSITTTHHHVLLSRHNFAQQFVMIIIQHPPSSLLPSTYDSITIIAHPTELLQIRQHLAKFGLTGKLPLSKIETLSGTAPHHSISIIINHQPSTINHQSSIINHQPSAVTHHHHHHHQHKQPS